MAVIKQWDPRVPTFSSWGRRGGSGGDRGLAQGVRLRFAVSRSGQGYTVMAEGVWGVQGTGRYNCRSTRDTTRQDVAHRPSSTPRSAHWVLELRSSAVDRTCCPHLVSARDLAFTKRVSHTARPPGLALLRQHAVQPGLRCIWSATSSAHQDGGRVWGAVVISVTGQSWCSRPRRAATNGGGSVVQLLECTDGIGCADAGAEPSTWRHPVPPHGMVPTCGILVTEVRGDGGTLTNSEGNVMFTTSPTSR